MRILIVEDEEVLASGLKFNFEQEGYSVVLAADGPSALAFFQDEGRKPCDLVILDLMLPGMSGYETCRAIREIDDHVPILVLSARTLAEDKAEAFDAGTDQYVTKPFALPELLARVRNLIERRKVRSTESAATPRTKGLFKFADCCVDFEKFEVSVAGTRHRLTTMEMQLLRYFIENEGKVLSRLQILGDVWNESSEITSRTIDNFVMRLRRLVESNPANPRHILSVRGTGYRFLAHPEPSN